MSNTDPSALEPVVGVYGLRTFRVSLDGKLLPIGHLSDDWDGGRCIARCAIGGDHTAPETDCTCGIYSFRDRVHLSKQFSAAHSLIAVVALEGTTIEGDRGWRSQAAQLVAVCIAHRSSQKAELARQSDLGRRNLGASDAPRRHICGSQPSLGDMVRIPGGQRAAVLGDATGPTELVIDRPHWPGSRGWPPSPALDQRARSARTRNHRAGDFSAERF